MKCSRHERLKVDGECFGGSTRNELKAESLDEKAEGRGVWGVDLIGGKNSLHCGI